MIELSQRLDDYVRKVIKYIIKNPELNYQMGDVEKSLQQDYILSQR